MNSKIDFANHGWLFYHLDKTIYIGEVGKLMTAADQIISDKPAWVKYETVQRFKGAISTRISRLLAAQKESDGH